MNHDLSQATPEEQSRLLVKSARDYALFVADTVGDRNPGVGNSPGYGEATFVGENTSLLGTPEDREWGGPQGEMEAVQDYALFLVSAEGRVLTWNPAAERLTGYPAEEILGQSVSVFFTEEDLARGQPEQELKTATKSGRSEAEHWGVHRDGSHFWTNDILSAIRDEAGALRGFTEIIRDLTERRSGDGFLRGSFAGDT